MKKWKEEYKNIKAPENMREKLEESIVRAQKDKKKVQKLRI